MRVPSLVWLASALLAVACGGSTTGSPSQDAATLIQKACNNAVGLQCQNGPTMQQCTDSANQDLSQAQAKGCVSQFDVAMQCFADKITDCSQDSSVVCSSQLNALESCQGSSSTGNNCSGFGGGAPPGAPSYYQSCGVSCGSWAVKCETKTSPTLVCTCTAGPKTGTTFTLTSCQGLTSSLAAPHCQG